MTSIPNFDNRRMFLDAVREGNIKKITGMLENGFNPNFSLGVPTITPLFISIRDRNIPVINLLLEYGADVNLFSDISYYHLNVNAILYMIRAIVQNSESILLTKSVINENNAYFYKVLQLLIDGGRPNFNVIDPQSGRSILRNAQMGTIYPERVNRMILDYVRRRHPVTSLYGLFGMHGEVANNNTLVTNANKNKFWGTANTGGAGAGGTGGRRRRRTYRSKKRT